MYSCEVVFIHRIRSSQRPPTSEAASLKGWKEPDKTGMLVQKWQDEIEALISAGAICHKDETLECAPPST